MLEWKFRVRQKCYTLRGRCARLGCQSGCGMEYGASPVRVDAERMNGVEEKGRVHSAERCS